MADPSLPSPSATTQTITQDVLNRATEAYYMTQVFPWDDALPPWSDLDEANEHASVIANCEEVALIVLQAAGLPIDASIG